MARPRIKNPMTHKVNFMIKPELAGFIKLVAEKSYSTESEVARHLFAAALKELLEKALNYAKTEKEKEALKHFINTQIVPLLSAQVMSVKL